MDKQHIINEIRRTAARNGGVPLGRDRFEQETGIKYHDWWGRFWSRWGDAVNEAGLAPNTLRGSYESSELMEKLIALTRELGRFPNKGDIRIKKLNDAAFPNDKTLTSHFGPRAQLREAALEYCRSHPGNDDIPPLLGPVPSDGYEQPRTEKPEPQVVIGFVYLMKYGKHYKIGKTNATGRREYELAIQLPEKLSTVHIIKTDDPDGIEAYWHKRFAMKRGNGEWFNLDPTDVQAFKRRKFM
jgi:hypothetical protein